MTKPRPELKVPTVHRKYYNGPIKVVSVLVKEEFFSTEADAAAAIEQQKIKVNDEVLHRDTKGPSPYGYQLLPGNSYTIGIITKNRKIHQFTTVTIR